MSLALPWRIFGACCVTGLFGGLLYEVFRPLHRVRKSLFLCVLADLIFSLIFTACYLLIATECSFPNLRWYMPTGILLGFLLYEKSLHKILAFLTEKLYNKIKHFLQKRRRGLCRKVTCEFQRKKRGGLR